MRENYTLKKLFVLLVVASFTTIMPAIAKNNGIYSDSTVSSSIVKLKDNRPNKPVFKNPFTTAFDDFMFKMTALKTGISADKSFMPTKSQAVKNAPQPSLDLQKPIENVKVYPNPVSDQINLSYSLKREGLVTIKILDVLGNEVSTLFNQKLTAGTQNNKFIIEEKLNAGFYFVRITSGSDSIIKRISVL